MVNDTEECSSNIKLKGKIQKCSCRISILKLYIFVKRQLKKIQQKIHFGKLWVIGHGVVFFSL